MLLGKYSLGIGDRFGHQGKWQLESIIRAESEGVRIEPVWNKSHREHLITGTKPQETFREAEQTVKAKGWQHPYYVDADHINKGNADIFIKWSNFFTLDVADWIGKSTGEERINEFTAKYEKYCGGLRVEGINEIICVDENKLKAIGLKYLRAIEEACSIYRHIKSIKGEGNFITEISMDETSEPQSSAELLFILAAIADEGIPAQTIAPKFTGSFHKGVDYIGDLNKFRKEFEEDLAIIRFAVKEFGLPHNLKLSIHSGSDKFSIYKPINEALKKIDAGVHLKTAGTTWLEELTGLAEASREGISIAKRIYIDAYKRIEELCAPYAAVVKIDEKRLPKPEVASNWSSDDFVSIVRNNPQCGKYDANVRQLLHLSYKIAAEMNDEFTNALERDEEQIGHGVTENLYQRHIKPLFIE